jgi:hypothetical protein
MQSEICNGPFRLTMLKTTQCKLCFTENVICTFLNMYPLYGWYFCNNCTNHVKSQAIDNMNIEIPLIGALPISYNDKYKILFERSNKQIWKGYIDPFLYIMKYSNEQKIYTIRVIFNANDPELGVNFNESYKDIPLNIIYKYNNDIYDKIINCENLFNSDKIKIAYNDLPENVQNKIKPI